MQLILSKINAKLNCIFWHFILSFFKLTTRCTGKFDNRLYVNRAGFVYRESLCLLVRVIIKGLKIKRINIYIHRL